MTLIDTPIMGLAKKKRNEMNEKKGGKGRKVIEAAQN